MSVNRYNSTTGELEKIAGGTLYADAPIGSIQAYGGTTAPLGWLLCQGQAVSRTAYAELFAVIGTAFGEGDSSTTFNIPDLREATTKGVGENPNGEAHVKTGGLSLGEFIDDRLQSHIHSIYNGFDGANPNSAERGDARHGYSVKSNNASGRTGATTEVKAVGVNYIIKAKQVAMPTDIQTVIEEQNSYSTEETYTGKRWIDGKPIYRKVYKCTAATSMSLGDDWKTVPGWSIDTSNMAAITYVFGSVYNWGRIDWVSQSNKLTWCCLNSTITIPIDAALIIEYTKTT